MAKVHDVPADMLIKKLSEILKSEDINPPAWISFVKTGVHADKPPQKVDWCILDVLLFYAKFT